MPRHWRAAAVAEAVRPTVLIVDDNPPLRQVLRCLLDDHGMTVVGEAADGRQGLELAWRLAPDVVVMDVRMPRLGGIEATRRLVATLPTTRVIVFTVHDEPEMREWAMQVGAAATVVKGEHPSRLIAAIEEAGGSGSPPRGRR